MASIAESVVWLAPELILVVFALLILAVDLVQKEKKDWPIYLSLVGLGSALLATAGLWGANQLLLFGTYTIDLFSTLLKLVAFLATALVTLSAFDYVAGGRGTMNPQSGSAASGALAFRSLGAEFYSLLLFAALAMALMASATDLIMIYLAIEFLSIASYILVGYLRDDPLSNEASIKYFLYGAIISAVMLYGMSLLYGLTGSTNLADIAAYFANFPVGLIPARLLGLIILVFLVAGFGFKISVVPFHQWAPDAYEGAPTPVTAFISVGPKVAGFAILLRVFLTALPYFQVDWMALLAGIAAITMTLGNLVAIPQKNIKRMLAYSSIAQAGYILLGVVAASSLGVASALFYLIIYTFTNLGAFVIVIIYSNWLGSDNIDDYAGFSERSPGLAMAMVLFLLSLAGIPPLAGFVGKFFLFAAVMERGFVWLVALGVMNSIVSLYYYLNVIKAMYIKRPTTEEPVPSSWALNGALFIGVVGVILLGVYPMPVIQWIQAAATTFLSI
ncbi:MAG: NADH-quinone oxidoreductase subunit N [Anaerolineae bacterium]